MKRFKFSLLFAALIAFLAACGSDGDGVTFGSLLVTVNGPEAANVSVSGPTTPGSQTVTDSFTFTDLTPGTYTITGEAAGYETSTATAVVVAGSTPATAQLSMPKIAQPEVSSVTLTPTSLNLEVGETATVQASVTGNEDLGRDDMSVTYQSSNTDVARVSREGVVTGVSSGSAVITATSDFDPSYFDTTRATVTFGSNQQDQTDGVLGISVSGNEGRVFDFVVTGPNGFNQTVSTSARTTLTVPAGSYTVTATETIEIDASLSYVATTAQQAATVTAGQLEEVAFSYARSNPAAEAVIDTFVFVSAVDAQGLDYFTTPERNTSKRVELTASQTEEVFCVTFEAQDADGNPVPNASVGIDITGAFVGNAGVRFDWDDVITVVPVPSGDCAALSLDTDPEANSVDTQQVAVDSTLTTDADGQVTFALFATDGIRPNEFVNTGFDGFEEEPAKVVLTASNANSTVVDELKIWFINITHLTYADNEPFIGLREIDNPFRLADGGLSFSQNHMSTVELAGAASLATIDVNGQEVGAFVNAFNTDGGNIHEFDTIFTQKQPQVNANDADLDDGFGNGFDPHNELGFMQYRIVVNTGDFFSFLGNDPGNSFGCDNLVNPELCFDNDGAATIVLADNATLNDPLDVCVEATYFVRASFVGDAVDYNIPLKSYTFCKTFRAGFLNIVKFADNHVLSWAGPQKNSAGRLVNAPFRDVGPIREGYIDTLSAFNHPPSTDDPFTSTYRIFIANPTTQPIRNIVISDDLPAELGIVLEGISPSGDFPTYDADNHTLTWDYRDPALAPLLNVLQPGEYLEFSYEVYARQKPGVQWTAPVRDAAAPQFLAPGFDEGWIDYARAPMYPNYQVDRFGPAGSVVIGSPYSPSPDNAYPDPYCITNGDDFNDENNRLGNDNDVTVEFDFDVPGGNRQFIDYDPIADESDICVVRPLYNITKRRVSDFTIERGQTAIYELIVRQVDRVDINAPALPLSGGDVPDGRESSAAEREYAWLAEIYPWEFGVSDGAYGGIGAGVGHRADAAWYAELAEILSPGGVPVLPAELGGFALTDRVLDPPDIGIDFQSRTDSTYLERDNPIGSNVTVLDTFDVGLDYVSDNDLMIINLDNGNRLHTRVDPSFPGRSDVEATIAGGRKPRPGTGSGARAVSSENPDFDAIDSVPLPAIADKRFQYETVDQFLPDDVGVSTITLRASLGSSTEGPEFDPINGSNFGNRQSIFLDDWDSDPTTGLDVVVADNPLTAANEAGTTVNVDGVWYNCAYLDANNLNQPTPLGEPFFTSGGPFLPESYGASWYNGQRGPNDPEVAYLDAGFFFGRPFVLRGDQEPYETIETRDITAGINDYPWDRNDTSNAVGEFLSTAEIAELAAEGNPLEYLPPYTPGNLPISYLPPDSIGIGEWATADYLVGSVNGALAITRPINSTGAANLNIFPPHANANEPLAGRNKDEVGGLNPFLEIIESVTGAVRNTGGLQRGLEGCAGVRATQEVPVFVGGIEFTPRGETFDGGTDGANTVAIQALVEVGNQYFYQIDFLNAGDTTIEDIVFTALFEQPNATGIPTDFLSRGSAVYVDNTGAGFPSQIFEGRITTNFPNDVDEERPFRLIGNADVVDDLGTGGPAGTPFGVPSDVPVGPVVDPIGLNRVVFNNGGQGYDLRPGRVLRLMIKAEGINGVPGSELALFTAYFNDVDGAAVRDFREIRDETDISTP